jgi:hypothetical protein
MAQVDSENSTATPVAPTRRLFLSTAATLAAGGAALGLAIPPALATADPIFVAIEAHKAAFARVIAAIDVEQAVEAAIPKGPTKGIDPRLIDSGKATSAAWKAECDAAIELVSVRPETMAGVVALLNYAISADRDGETWPRELVADDGETVGSWHHFLIRNLTKSCPAFCGRIQGRRYDVGKLAQATRLDVSFAATRQRG